VIEKFAALLSAIANHENQPGANHDERAIARANTRARSVDLNFPGTLLRQACWRTARSSKSSSAAMQVRSR
jgi:hypothetical protein